MISNLYCCIFVHIPRTGGNSIETILWPGERTEEDLWMGFVNKYENKYQTGGLQHLFARHIREEVGAGIFDRYFKFSMVRNPWDKAVSQYSYMKRRPDLREYIGLSEGDCFKKYLERIGQKKHVQWESQYKFITDEHGELMVDFVGRYEDYQAVVSALLKHLGFAEMAIPRTNAADRAEYQQYYDGESIETVAELYARDIELFNYTYARPSAIPPPAGRTSASVRVGQAAAQPSQLAECAATAQQCMNIVESPLAGPCRKICTEA